MYNFRLYYFSSWYWGRICHHKVTDTTLLYLLMIIYDRAATGYRLGFGPPYSTLAQHGPDSGSVLVFAGMKITLLFNNVIFWLSLSAYMLSLLLYFEVTYKTRWARYDILIIFMLSLRFICTCHYNKKNIQHKKNTIPIYTKRANKLQKHLLNIKSKYTSCQIKIILMMKLFI